jgi:DNA transposition AAA+ family ATPase
VEFCEACRRDRYIGLCYGPPGVGKTLSAIHHNRIQKIVPLDRWNAEASDAKPIDTVLFTPEVVNTPTRIENDVRGARSLLCSVAKRATRAEDKFERINRRIENGDNKHIKITATGDKRRWTLISPSETIRHSQSEYWCV